MRALALLRRNPDFRRFYLANLISSGGDWFALIPLLALLHRLTGTGLYGGLVLTADTLVFALLSPYAGTLADRVDRKRIVVVAEVVSVGFVLLLLLVDASTPWLGVVGIGGVAAAKAFAQPAGGAATPNLVPLEDLALATVMNGIAWGSMLAVGAALGGLLSAVAGTSVCFLVDAASFVLSALLVQRCRTSFQATRVEREHPGFRVAIGEAYRYARADRVVLALLTAKPGIAFANGALVLFPLLATDVFGVGEGGLGLMYAARGLGVLLGPLALGSGGRERANPFIVLAVGSASCGLLYLGVSVTPWFALALLLITLAHLGGGSNYAVTTYGLQRRVPDQVRGRILSADAMIVTFAIAVNQAVAGALSDIVPTRPLVAGFAGASVAYAAVWFVATRSLRNAPVESGV